MRLVRGMDRVHQTEVVSDQKGCFEDTSITVFEPSAISADTIAQDSVSCNGLANGRAVIDSISGGNGIYSYAWILQRVIN